MSSLKKGNAFLWTVLLLLGVSLVLRIHWLTGCASALLVFWYIDYSLHPVLEGRWHELLDAIRGRRQSSLEDEQDREQLLGLYRQLARANREEECKQQQEQEYDQQVEAAHQKSQYKHIAGKPWGDPSSYVREPTPEELLEQQREAEANRPRRAAGGATVSEVCPISRELQNLHSLLHSSDFVIADTTVSDHEVTEFYNQNRNQHCAWFSVAEPQHRVAMIVVNPWKSPQVCNRKNDDAANDLEARRKCDALLEKLDQGADFEQLAMDYSEDPRTAATGGDLGYIAESALSQADPALKEAVLALRPGQVSGVIEVRDSYRILKLTAREAPGQRDLSDPAVWQSIRDYLRSRNERFLHVAYPEADRRRVDEVVEAIADFLKEDPRYIRVAALYQLLTVTVRNIERVKQETPKTQDFAPGDKQFLRDMGIAP
jgi:hypothetical protein